MPPWGEGGGNGRLPLTAGDAEISAEKRRSQREDERGDSGGWGPPVRRHFDAEARRKKSPSLARIGRLKPAPPKHAPVVDGDGKPETVILTRRRGDAEISAEKRRSQREDERGDSGGWWPSVRSGRVSGGEAQSSMPRTGSWWNGLGNPRV